MNVNQKINKLVAFPANNVKFKKKIIFLKIVVAFFAKLDFTKTQAFKMHLKKIIRDANLLGKIQSRWSYFREIRYISLLSFHFESFLINNCTSTCGSF